MILMGPKARRLTAALFGIRVPGGAMISAMRCGLVAASIVFWAGSVFAQPAPEGAQPKAQQSALPPAQTVDAVVLIMLAKSTILAVQHANATGNYSVLRDLGTPVFRERFDQAKLTAIFANLRMRGVNLTPVIMLPVNWTKQPEITPQGQLHWPASSLRSRCRFNLSCFSCNWTACGGSTGLPSMRCRLRPLKPLPYRRPPKVRPLLP